MADHRTLGQNAPKRKEVIRTKICEKRARAKSIPRPTNESQPMVAEASKIKLPENYLAVMAAAVTIAEKREAEAPGSFRFIIDEIPKANGIPQVKLSQSVIKYQNSEGEGATGRESRKRQHSYEGSRIPIRREPIEPKGEYVLMPDGFWYLKTATPATAPSQSTHTTPAPTPQTSSTPTPTPTPATSERQTGAIKKKKEESQDPGMIVIVRSDVAFSERMTRQQFFKEVDKQKTMKLVFTNTMPPRRSQEKCQSWQIRSVESKENALFFGTF